MTTRPLSAPPPLDPLLASANAPRWTARKRSFYEVYWVKWNDPARGGAGWLRYILTTSAQGDARLEVWACRLRADGTPPQTARASVPMRDVRLSAAPFVLEAPRFLLTGDRAQGAIATPTGELAWDVALHGPTVAVRHLPSALYSLPLPRGKLVSSRCFTRVDATMTVDGVQSTSRDVLGQLAHFWGTRDQPYFWVSCGSFAEDASAFVEVIGGEASVGPVPLPPVAFVNLRWRGEDYRLNDPIRAAANRYRAQVGEAEVEARSGPLRFRIEATAAPERIVAHPFVNPDSRALFVHTSYFADVRLEVATRVRGGFRRVDELTAQASAALDVARVGRDPRVVPVFAP